MFQQCNHMLNNMRNITRYGYGNKKLS